MAFKILEPGRKVSAVKVTDPIRYQCDKSKAPQIIFLASWANALGIEAKTKVTIMVGEGEDKGHLIVRPDKAGRWTVGYPGSTKRQLSIKSKVLPFLGSHPPIACKGVLETDAHGADFIRIQLPSTEEVREANARKAERRDKATITKKDVGVLDRRAIDPGRSA